MQCSGTQLLQLFCLSFIVIQAVDGYAYGLNNTRVRRQANGNGKKKGNCPTDGFYFRCKSGECISEDKECDGAVDCRDGSDETNSCHRIKCPSHLFRCKYGACIESALKCDGKPDCKDKSDETTADCDTNNFQSETCRENEFRCGSGECINEALKCDGIKHCKDHSDEISATCLNLKCPGFTYKCKYGACVDGDAECNGKVDCFDGSDEDPNICKSRSTPPTVVTPTTEPNRPVTNPTSSSSGKCILPSHPNFGYWSVFGSSTGLNPGTSVNEGTILQVFCNKGYKLDGLASAIFCKEDGNWSENIGTCLKTCPSIYSSEVMKVTCIFKNTETENCTDPIEGTLAKYQCAHFYEDLDLLNKPYHICRDGSWNERRPKCSPVCGRKSVTATTLIVNGTEVTRGDYPWQVAIYREKNKQLICGGSLINQRVILTAAHCITNLKGVMHPKENYIVAVGKYYAQFNDSRDANEAQFSTLDAMFIPDTYKGHIQNYLGDIAVLITNKTFTLSTRVQPVCVDWGSNLMNLLSQKDYGYVTGWGFTAENKNPSEVLKELKVPPYVSYQQCLESLPEDYEIYLTNDKLCAGYVSKGTSVCRGDSGGGLVYKFNGRYYITGIVSLSPSAPSGGCNSQTYGLYTRVDIYTEKFIFQKSEFRHNIQ